MKQLTMFPGIKPPNSRIRKDHGKWQREHPDKANRNSQRWRDRNREAFNARAREMYQKNQPKIKERFARKFYGISYEEYQNRLAFQDGKCGICKSPISGKNAHLDHDHKTKALRGFLCGKCNKALGLLADDPELIRVAAKWIEGSNPSGDFVSKVIERVM